MRFVLDTSVTFSAIAFGRGKPLLLFEALMVEETHEMCVSLEMIEELERKLVEKHHDSVEVSRRLARYKLLTTRIEPDVPIEACRDANDDFILECAVAAGAEVIVSSDADLRVLHGQTIGGLTLQVYSVNEAYSKFVEATA